MKALALIAILAATPALANPACNTREEMQRVLTEHYGEHVVGQGINARGLLMQVWANEETGSWTITLTTPDGRSCLMNGGAGFERLVTTQGDET